MKYRRFGRTELAMPVLSCGGMRYQKGWKDEPPEAIEAEQQANLEKTVLRALELGINHIETARGYGTSEMQLGRLLPKLPREKMIVQTKIAPQENKQAYLDTFDKSMAYLGLDYVDLLAIHGINNDELLEQTLKKDGSLEAAREIQRQGRARHIGFSTHAPTPTILRAIETGEFDYVNLHWYFFNEGNAAAVQAATQRDMGVFIISPSDKGGKLYEPPQKLVEFCQPLSPMQFNDLYCLSHPEIHTLSIGAARPTDFDDHVAALEHYDRAGEAVAPIAAKLNKALSETLGVDWTGDWAHTLPPFYETPGTINIPEIVRLWSCAKVLDMVAYGKMRYNLLGNGGHWFPGLNAAEFDETAIRKAVAGHPLADRIPTILREAHELLFEAPKKRLSEGG